MTGCLADEGANYHIRVQGRLDPQSAARLGEMTKRGLRACDLEGGDRRVDEGVGRLEVHECLLLVAELFHDGAKPRECREMARLARQHLPDVLEQIGRAHV